MTVNNEGWPDSNQPAERIDALEQRVKALEDHIRLTTPFDVDPMDNRCPLCELKFEGTMGYCCSRYDCPMQAKVSDFPFGLNTGG